MGRRLVALMQSGGWSLRFERFQGSERQYGDAMMRETRGDKRRKTG